MFSRGDPPKADKEVLCEFDKAEHQRITEEILKDRELQFRLFWQSITVTAIIYSFCASVFEQTFWFRFPFIILSTHLILIPTATIILNRARTANRKSGYILAVFDVFSQRANWEKHLSILRKETEGEPHRASTIRSMLISITALEFVSMTVFIVLLFAQPDKNFDGYRILLIALGACYSGIYAHLLAERSRKYFCTKYDTSIQGFATEWSRVLALEGKAVESFGNWDTNTWQPSLNNERTVGTIKYLWKIVWSQTPQPSGKWDFKRSVIKPILVTSVFYLVFGIITYSAKITLPVAKGSVTTISEKELNYLLERLRETPPVRPDSLETTIKQ